jgi:large subunit ribosomal protein L21
MYAVIQTGGKQYRVSEKQVIEVEKLSVEPGSIIDLNDVLMYANGDDIRIGAPRLSDIKVNAKVMGHGRGEKVMIVKMRRRKHSRKQMGHRQYYTQLQITQISA